MKTFLVGRDKASDVAIADRSVSARHAELVVTAGNELFVTDCASTNGTFVWRVGEWRKLRQDFVKLDEKLMFGRYEMGVNELLHRAHESRTGRVYAKAGDPLAEDHVIRGEVRRDEFGRPVGKV